LKGSWREVEGSWRVLQREFREKLEKVRTDDGGS